MSRTNEHMLRRQIVQTLAELSATVDLYAPSLEGQNLNFQIEQLLEAMDAWHKNRQERQDFQGW